MASTKSILNKAARELNRMRRDLRAMLSDHNLVWYEPRPVPHTLPEAEQVTPWRFACQFLAEFEQWRQAVNRWARLFGPENQPDLWRDIQQRCARLAEHIVGHRAFHDAIIADGVAQRLLGEPDRGFESTLEGAFERIMLEQQQQALVRMLSSDTVLEKSLSRFLRNEAMDRRFHGQFAEYPAAAALILEWHLCRYRNAMLQARCLQLDSDTFWPTHVLLERQHRMKVTDMISTNQNLGIDMTDELRSILNTLEGLISELGFEGAWEQLTADDFETLPTGRGGRQPINVIPSDRRRTACASTVLALFKVAASRKPAIGFRNIMSELRTHLVDCHPTTQTAILITDWWNAKTFAEEHFNELAAWRRKGVQILILLVSEPGSILTPLRIWT